MPVTLSITCVWPIDFYVVTLCSLTISVCVEQVATVGFLRARWGFKSASWTSHLIEKRSRSRSL
jgi:hypothetical protein